MQKNEINLGKYIHFKSLKPHSEEINNLILLNKK
jgi:hypothetical protein